MTDLQEVFEIHKVLIQEFGCIKGARDERLLKSAFESLDYKEELLKGLSDKYL